MTDYTDLIARLRDAQNMLHESKAGAQVRAEGICAMQEAAAAIADLEAERDALRDALRSIEHLTDNDRIRGIATAVLTAPKGE